MTSGRDVLIRGSLLFMTVMALAGAGRLWLSPPAGVRFVQLQELPALAAVSVRRTQPDSLARSISARNPFRIHRTASQVRFSTDVSSGATPLPAPPPRPALSLAGIVVGDEPVALVNGLPGIEGTRALRLGESAGGYKLREISAERAVLAGSDTTYTLTVRSRIP
jgi:hypothetical protein